MNKNIIILSLFLLGAVSVFAQVPPVQNQQEKLLTYTPSKDYKEPENTWVFSQRYKFDYNKKYGLSFALETGKVLFYILEDGIIEKPTNISDKNLAEKNALENELNKSKRQKDLSNMITKAFRVWFDDTKAAIEKAGRQDEFKDIMPILTKSVEPISKANAITTAKLYGIPVVAFLFTTENKMHKICGEYDAGCYGHVSYGSEIVIVNPYTRAKSSFFTKHQIYTDLIHEIGHWYGLGDQYKGADNSDSEYSTGNDRIKDGTSVMASGDYTHLTCDDIDGFINLIDFTLSKQKKSKFTDILEKTWSKRTKRGWASFCNGKEGYKNTYYKMAKPVQSL